MDFAQIIECEVNECAYNVDYQCHTPAITVGGTIDHKCDTFLNSTMKGGFPETHGMVGACKADSCCYNKSFECSAPGIKVGHHGNDIDCLTYVSD